ncbi:MAG: PhnD/SsuA/transferrin family substrate-binding protein [Anaerolineales bacterium]|nr:PhnD/SsuA/transferrin family substrate-binding protein [Anaerolineales bacterium]
MTKRVYLLFIIAILGCSLPNVTITQPATETPLPLSSPTLDSAPLPPTAELGLAENPLILALAPSTNTPEQITAAKALADQFMQRTGYVVVTTIPDSYSALIEAFEKGNAHMALLDPTSYALAYQKGLAHAQYAVVKEKKIKYGAQFLAGRKGGFTSYFDDDAGENTADATVALAQFSEKKPCWSEETSLSGYVIPLGVLNQAQVPLRPAAFVGGQTTVVRSIYAGGICDFGASYVDARKFPSLEDEFPDLMEQVLVIWQVPEIIPYEVFVFSDQMSQSMQTLFYDLIPPIMQTDEGSAAFKTVYDIDELQAVNDGDFVEFQTLIDESRVDLYSLLRQQ